MRESSVFESRRNIGSTELRPILDGSAIGGEGSIVGHLKGQWGGEILYFHGSLIQKAQGGGDIPSVCDSIPKQSKGIIRRSVDSGGGTHRKPHS